MKRKIVFFITAVLAGIGLFVSVSAAGFADVDPNAYYAKAVAWAVERGITNGVTAESFSPNQTCTRAQIITMIWREAGSPVPSTYTEFSDVPDALYCFNAVQWAAEKKIIVESSFRPSESCTRAAAVEFLWRSTGCPAPTTPNKFSDVPSQWPIQQAVMWAVEKGITGGVTATTFEPDIVCTRGHIVTFLHRMRVPEAAVPASTENNTSAASAGETDDTTTMYAIDGTTKEVPNSEVAAYEAKGWYSSFVDYVLARTDLRLSQDDFDGALDFVYEHLVEANDIYEYVKENSPESTEIVKNWIYLLTLKGNSICEEWQKRIGSPIAIISKWMTTNSIGTPVIKFEVRNLTLKTIASFEIEFTCVDAYGKVTTDYPSLYNGTVLLTVEEAGDIVLNPWGKTTVSSTLYSNSRTYNVQNVSIVRAVASDGTKW